MSLHSDLLAQAQHLLHREPSRGQGKRAPKSGINRLLRPCPRLLKFMNPRTVLVSNAPLRLMITRTFTHTEMYKASRSFAGGALPDKGDDLASARPATTDRRPVATRRRRFSGPDYAHAFGYVHSRRLAPVSLPGTASVRYTGGRKENQCTVPESEQGNRGSHPTCRGSRLAQY